MTHNHMTRDVKPPGECPSCDLTRNRSATRSFWKVMFSAQEVLDLVTECDTLEEFGRRMAEQAEERSRE